MANRDLTPQELATLESLIDATNLQSVLMGLSEICGEKAEHIASSYGDAPSLVKAWNTASGKLGITAVSREVCALPL